MKKALLLLGLIAAGATTLNAQSNRTVLYEEFTGENCPPCAATNPSLWNELNQNASKIIFICYMSPIPSAGPLYNQNPTVAQDRINYYGVSFAPWGEMDGAIPPGVTGQNPNHPGYVVNSPSTITQAQSVASPFTISITNDTINSTSLSATIHVTANQAESGTNLKLRAALVETLNFATAPGTNGETNFQHVVRKMYPSPDGQSIPNTWTNGQSQTFTIQGAVPSYVDLNDEHFIVVWIQEDGNKKVLQSARTYPPYDVASMGITVPGGSSQLHCGLPTSVTPTVTIQNGGTNTLTSAKIYYKVSGASTWQTQDWTGNLALNQSTTVTLGAVNITTAGRVIIEDSVGLPNGMQDKVLSNDVSATAASVLANSNGQALPISNDFETYTPSWVAYATSGNTPLSQYTGSGLGYNGSNGFLLYPCFSLQSGTGYNILPFASLPSGPKALDFYVAYAQYSGNLSASDQLEVVYSTDCGQSWTSVWSKSGSDLATAAATSSQFLPSGNSDWKLYSVDMSNVPDGAQIAFRATSHYGNNIFVDHVNLRTGAPTEGVQNVALNKDNLSIYPNPVANKLTVDLTITQSSSVNFSVVNLLGQKISTVVKNLTKGDNKVSLNTEALAPGVYFLNVATETSSIQRKFVKK